MFLSSACSLVCAAMSILAGMVKTKAMGVVRSLIPAALARPCVETS